MAEISGDGVTGSTPRFLGACRPTRFGKSIRYFVKEKISRGFVSEKSSVTRDGLFRVQNHHIKFGASDKAYREKRTQSKSVDRKAQPQLAPKFKLHPKSDNARSLEVFKTIPRCGRCFLDTTQQESDCPIERRTARLARTPVSRFKFWRDPGNLRLTTDRCFTVSEFHPAGHSRSRKGNWSVSSGARNAKAASTSAIVPDQPAPAS